VREKSSESVARLPTVANENHGRRGRRRRRRRRRKGGE